MWLIFPSSPFSCDSGRFLLGWGDKFSIFLHIILFSAKPVDPPSPPKYQIYWATKNNKGGLWRFAETRLEITFLNLFLRTLTTKFKGVAGNRGSDRSMLLKPKVKWFRCFLNSEFYFIKIISEVYFPSPKCHKLCYVWDSMLFRPIIKPRTSLFIKLVTNFRRELSLKFCYFIERQ